ncbi:acyl-CoA dehydrogenase family protein [Amycolatopsis ultiminotia]|uniref:Acyl-CoA dehydrogenase family protein n=1 Tax=Amycolatopsis ultiminotia TaxID=543629 RepID=A0ABP6V4G1_9PSEU
MDSVGLSDRAVDYTARFGRFLEQEVAPLEEDLAAKRAGTPWQPHLDEAGRMHPAVWAARREVQRRSARAGLYQPHLGAHVGGGGFSRVEMHHVEEFVYRTAGLGLGLAALGWTESGNPALEHASGPARERYLDPLMAGEVTTAFANTERSVGTDVLAMQTHARRDGGDWIVNGQKAWITNAHFADFFQVVAVTEPGAGTRSLSMFLVDADAPGFSRGRDIPTILGDGLTGELELRDVRVPAENVVGEVGDGFALAMSWINWRRVTRGGMCAGWSGWLMDRALERATRRTVSGRPIADLQVIQHLLADMDADRFAARAASLVAQERLDALGPFAIPLSPEAPRLISLIKLINDEAFFRVVDRAVQINGAVGLIQGSPEEKLFRIARNLRIPAGTSEIQRNSIARRLLREHEGPAA